MYSMQNSKQMSLVIFFDLFSKPNGCKEKFRCIYCKCDQENKDDVDKHVDNFLLGLLSWVKTTGCWLPSPHAAKAG